MTIQSGLLQLTVTSYMLEGKLAPVGHSKAKKIQLYPVDEGT